MSQNTIQFQRGLSLSRFQVLYGSVPLRFLAMYLMTQNKNAVSALALKRQLGVSYSTAWLLKHKLMLAMGQRDGRYLLQGRVEIDDAYLGASVRAPSTAGARRPTKASSLLRCKPMRTAGPSTSSSRR